MTRGGRRMLLLAPLVLAALFAVAFLLLNAWLESAGGRQAVARALSDAIGVPVRLEGEFRVMLLPSPGVSGTAVVLGEPGAGTEVARCEEYAVSLALEPLLERRLLIESVRFADGALYPDRWPQSDEPGPGMPPADLRLPEIERLDIENLRVFVGEGDEQPYLIHELTVDGFAAGRTSPFRLRVRDYGDWSGHVTFVPVGSAVELSAAGTGAWPGEIRLDARVSLGNGSGTLEADWSGGPADSGFSQPARLSLAYASAPTGLGLRGVRFTSDPLLIVGDGCLFTSGRPALNLELQAERLDVDALPDFAALTGPGESTAEGSTDSEGPAGLDLNVRLAVAELLAGGAIARQAVLRLGGEPDCQALAEVAAD